MNGDPVSWFVIERGWKVLDANGEHVGAVDEIIGDSSNDIFNGLAISTRVLGRPRYVPAEKIGSITDGCIRLALSGRDVGRLDEFEEPATTAHVLPEDAGLATRAAARVEAPTHRTERRVTVRRRLTFTLQRLLRRR